MPAVITDQIRVLNATNFVSGISTTDNSYYVFIGLPNATSVASDWNTATPAPIDNFDEHDNIYDTLISGKKNYFKRRFEGNQKNFMDNRYDI